MQGILAFAERILPRASDLWVQASLDYKQRLQQLFFPEGIAYDGNRFNRTAATAPLFNYLAPSECADEKMVSRLGIEPRTRRLRLCCSASWGSPPRSQDRQPPSRSRPASIWRPLGDRINESSLAPRIGVPSNELRLTMCFAGEGARTHIRNPDLNRAQASTTQSRTMRANLISGARCFCLCHSAAPGGYM